MRFVRTFILAGPMLCAACAGSSDRHTLAGLRYVEPDVTEVQIDDGLDQAMKSYRQFLEQTPESALTPEAMRRLADLKLEKDFGIHGGDAPFVARPTMDPPVANPVEGDQPSRTGAGRVADHSESEQAFERRAESERPVDRTRVALRQ